MCSLSRTQVFIIVTQQTQALMISYAHTHRPIKQTACQTFTCKHDFLPTLPTDSLRMENAKLFCSLHNSKTYISIVQSMSSSAKYNIAINKSSRREVMNNVSFYSHQKFACLIRRKTVGDLWSEPWKSSNSGRKKKKHILWYRFNLMAVKELVWRETRASANIYEAWHMMTRDVLMRGNIVNTFACSS